MDDLNIEDEVSKDLIERIHRAKEDTGVAPRRNQLEEFMASSARMLDIQRHFILDEESKYQVERIRLLDSFRVKLENIKFECSVAVRRLDEEHQKKTADAKKLLDRLAVMRDMPL
jgi:hypothetical protein